MEFLKDKRNGVFKFFIILFSFFICYSFFMSWSFQFQLIDDAYISFQYGKNFINGNGFVFNPGEYVEGCTNFLWTIITSPFVKIGFIDISVFAIILGVIMTLFSLYVLYKAASSMNELFEPASPVTFLFPSLFFAVDNSVAFWSVSGLETSLFVLFLITSVYCYFNINRDDKYIYLFIVSSVLCTLTRPEGNFIFCLFFLNLLLHGKHLPIGWKKLIKLGLLYILFIILYYSFKYFYFGNILPNTFYAKGAANLDLNLLLGYNYVRTGVKARVLVLLLIFIPLRYIRNYKVSFLYLFLTAYLGYVISVGGDWPAGNRFLVPVLPSVYLLSLGGIVILAGYLKKLRLFSWIRKNNLVYTSGILLAVFLLFNTARKLEYTLLITPLAINHEKEQANIGKWLKVNAPPGSVVATGLAGKIPYYSELYSIDMLGLCNKKIARIKTRDMTIAHQKFDLEYVLSLNPDYIIGGFYSFKAEDIPGNYDLIIQSTEENGYIPVYRRKKDNPPAH